MNEPSCVCLLGVLFVSLGYFIRKGLHEKSTFYIAVAIFLSTSSIVISIFAFFYGLDLGLDQFESKNPHLRDLYKVVACVFILQFVYLISLIKVYAIVRKEKEDDQDHVLGIENYSDVYTQFV